MADSGNWDFVVIGGGSAGLVASRTAASFGAKTLLIEGARLGGDCLWTGCVPSKSLIASAAAATAARDSAHLGVASAEASIDFAAVMRHVRGAMHEIAPVDSPEALAKDGVEVLRGHARFTGPRALDVDGRRIGFVQAMIATGGSPAVPGIAGADDLELLTSESIWELTELPRRLVVIGGGAIGCEIAQAMARLGSQVTIVHRGPRLLPKEEERASAIVTAALRRDGVTVLTSRGSTALAGDGTRLGGTVTLDDGQSVPFDAILAAVGRRPNTGSLDAATGGVRLDGSGHVEVNARLRTSNPRVWAAGDVTALAHFTHTAGVNGSIAASNAVLGLTRSIDTVAVPRVTFTHPEVATVGLLASDAAAKGLITRSIDHHHVDRAVAEGATTGYTSLLVDRRGRVRGATIVGPRAGESLGEASLAVKNGMSTSDIAGTTHAYPTFSDALWNAAVADVRARLGSGLTARATRVLRATRARRLR
ncbi:dihydrolipoyl dehydrogenase family protein [Marisediminicola senii]|uniref:dihydrolipoyl dehydrogenase family protein n=1 Tax=Marisediminicola senii TaxID=2711233 RepID=UPI0013ED4B95|nr:FAD-dependent oxidoreductase [Marisediminicola senii]